MEKWILIAALVGVAFMVFYGIIDVERQIKKYEKGQKNRN